MTTWAACNSSANMCPIQWIIGFVLLVIVITGLIYVIIRRLVESDCYKIISLYFQTGMSIELINFSMQLCFFQTLSIILISQLYIWIPTMQKLYRYFKQKYLNSPSKVCSF